MFGEQLGRTLLKKGKNGEAVFESNRSGGYSVAPRGYPMGILSTVRKDGYQTPTPKTFNAFSALGGQAT